ncbi:MAG: hypothetical protein UT94_C0049G0008 [Candidatus Uhrbacteria bacterium GW2011_GWF2_40_263]|nr:MAG: hypothetical protein UT94_C0049G0008 [Candidatus Uhrbacteria bacterium GW2011_GWF2_40_263]
MRLPRIGFPHSEISGSKVACHLPEAYRRLLRPSSARFAKASTVCPLDALQPLKDLIFRGIEFIYFDSLTQFSSIVMIDLIIIRTRK